MLPPFLDRVVLIHSLHSLAHMLITAISLEAGYSAATPRDKYVPG